MQNRKLFEIIFHVGGVTSLQIWVAKNHVTVKRALMNECSISDLPSNFEAPTCNIISNGFCFAFFRSYIFISDKKVKTKSYKK